MIYASNFSHPRYDDHLLIAQYSLNKMLSFQDSADGIANELLTAGLIVGDDLVSMAANLDRSVVTYVSKKKTHVNDRVLNISFYWNTLQCVSGIKMFHVKVDNCPTCE